jgi:hypothetical protein
MVPETTALGAIDTVGQIVNKIRYWRRFATPTSLSEITQNTRVEPLCLIDTELLQLEELPEISAAMQAIFAGYYMHGLSLISVLGDITVSDKLGRVNPNRPVFESLKLEDLDKYTLATLSKDAYKHQLPTRANSQKLSLAMLANDSTIGINDTDRTKDLKELSSLAIGKVYDVELCHEGAVRAKVKVMIRLFTNSLTSQSLINLFTFKNQFDMSFKERWYQWRSGRIGFFMDLILCRDLIAKHRNTMILDRSRVYEEIISRQNKNTLAGFISQKSSLATISNLAIISANTASAIESALGGKLEKASVRDQIFKNTNLMVLAVVDPSWKRVQFYHYSINSYTDVAFKDIKLGMKQGENIADIFKAFAEGKAPTL